MITTAYQNISYAKDMPNESGEAFTYSLNQGIEINFNEKDDQSSNNNEEYYILEDENPFVRQFKYYYKI